MRKSSNAAQLARQKTAVKRARRSKRLELTERAHARARNRVKFFVRLESDDHARFVASAIRTHGMTAKQAEARPLGD